MSWSNCAATILGLLCTTASCADSGRDGGASTAKRNCLALPERLTGDFPDVPQSQLGLAETLKHFAHGAVLSGRNDEAESAATRAVQLCRDLVDRFPSVPLHHEQLIDTEYELLKLREAT